MAQPANKATVDPLEAAVAAFIDAQGLLARDDSVVVGVSGGADSVALLNVLHHLAADTARAYKLTVAHLHHGLRNSADADAEFVAQLAKRLDLPLVLHRVDAAARARKTGQSVESAARELRYALFADVATEANASAVAVGHHADDNVETILQRIARGTHLRGLAGIPPKRDLPDHRAAVVRPLLKCRRAEIEDYCRRHGLDWRTDETNADTDYTRNFIRHELLPLLRERVNPRADEALGRLAEAAGGAEDYLCGRARQALDQARWAAEPNLLSLERRAMLARSAIIQQYALRIALEDLGVPMQAVGTDRIDTLVDMLHDHGPAALSLPGRFTARREGPNLVLQLRPDMPPEQAPPEPVEIACPGRTPLPDGRMVLCRVEPFDRKTFETHCRRDPPGVELLDADAIQGRLTCRPRQDGDSFRPLGAGGTQSVSDFLTNTKAPAVTRDTALCVCDDKGIVYLLGCRIDARVKVTAQTRQILRLELSRSA